MSVASGVVLSGAALLYLITKKISSFPLPPKNPSVFITGCGIIYVLLF